MGSRVVYMSVNFMVVVHFHRMDFVVSGDLICYILTPSLRYISRVWYRSKQAVGQRGGCVGHVLQNKVVLPIGPSDW